MRSLVRAILEDPIFAADVGPVEVTEAQSGFVAMRWLPRTKFDLILTDINMPDVNDLELIHFVRRSEQYRSSPLVIIASQATERGIVRGTELGSKASVPTTYFPEALREVCARVVGQQV